MEGIVLRSINNIYSVRSEEGVVYSCRIKGKQLAQAKGEYNPIVVGDVVDFTLSGEGSSEGLVTFRHCGLCLQRGEPAVQATFHRQSNSLLQERSRDDCAEQVRYPLD